MVVPQIYLYKDGESMENKFYCYIYLDPRKPGRFSYGDFITFFYEPFYVGKGCRERSRTHLNIKNTKTKFKATVKAILNIGIEPIIIKVIENIIENCSFCYEKCLISLIGREDLNLGSLLNLTDGGDGNNNQIRSLESINKFKITRRITAERKGYYFSEETKRKIIKSNTGKIRTEKFKKDISDRLKGKKLTEEHKKKIGESGRGRKHTEETKKKISICSIGRKHNTESIIKIKEARSRQVFTEEHRKKIKYRIMGSGNPFFGKKHKEETIIKNRNIKLEYYRIKRLFEEEKEIMNDLDNMEYECILFKRYK